MFPRQTKRTETGFGVVGSLIVEMGVGGGCLARIAQVGGGLGGGLGLGLGQRIEGEYAKTYGEDRRRVPEKLDGDCDCDPRNFGENSMLDQHTVSDQPNSGILLNLLFKFQQSLHHLGPHKVGQPQSVLPVSNRNFLNTLLTTRKNTHTPSLVTMRYVPLSCHAPFPPLNAPLPSTSTLPKISSGQAILP